MVRAFFALAVLAVGATACGGPSLKCLVEAPGDGQEESPECAEYYRKEREKNEERRAREIEDAKPARRKECAALGMAFGPDVTQVTCPDLCVGREEHGCDLDWTCNRRYDGANDRTCGKAGVPEYCVRCANPLTADERRALEVAARIEREKQEAADHASAEEKERLEAAAQLRRDADAAEAKEATCTEPRLRELHKVLDTFLSEHDRSGRRLYQLDGKLTVFATKSMREHRFPPASGTIAAGAPYVFVAISAVRTQLKVDGSSGDSEYNRQYDGVPFAVHFVRLERTAATSPAMNVMGASCVLVAALRVTPL